LVCVPGTNNYICITRGTATKYVFFDDREREAVLRAIDTAAASLAELGSSINSVLRTGRHGDVEAVIFRACANIPLPVVGEKRLLRLPVD
jgi:hypothetical protein